jgi:hypothetical protein
LPSAFRFCELRVLGIDALNKVLGPVEALRFLALFNREPTDYIEFPKGFTRIRVWKKSLAGKRTLERLKVNPHIPKAEFEGVNGKLGPLRERTLAGGST